MEPTNGNERAGETNRTYTALHRRHCQTSCGVFGQILVFLMPRHTFFSIQVRATCATCAKVIYPRGHCSCRSAVHPLRRMSLSMAYLQVLRFDDIWHITARADPLWRWVSAQICSEPFSVRPLTIMTAYANSSTPNRHSYDCFRRD